MNNNPQTILSDSQKRLVAELVEAYGIEPSEVIFFSGDPKPFLSYEATCSIANSLTDLREIAIEPVDSTFVDSLSLRCTLALADGRRRSAVGVVNVNESADGKPMTPAQLYQAASSRAIRNALRTAGIDLIKLHELHTSGQLEFSGPPRSNRASLIAQVHALGTEVGFIVGDNKAGWKRLLLHRYGVESSAGLNEEQLADLVGALRAVSAGSARPAAA